MTTPSHDEKIANLEIELAYQAETIATLNDTITEQWTKLDRLSKEIERLKDQIASFEAAQGPEGPEPPPPHY